MNDPNSDPPGHTLVALAKLRRHPLRLWMFVILCIWIGVLAVTFGWFD